MKWKLPSLSTTHNIQFEKLWYFLAVIDRNIYFRCIETARLGSRGNFRGRYIIRVMMMIRWRLLRSWVWRFRRLVRICTRFWLIRVMGVGRKGNMGHLHRGILIKNIKIEVRQITKAHQNDNISLHSYINNKNNHIIDIFFTNL